MEEAWMKKVMAVAMAMNIVAVGSSAGIPFGSAPSGGSTTSFQQCYVGCFILCAIQPAQTLSSCGFECLRDCLIPQSPSAGDTVTTTASTSRGYAVAATFHFCNLGCASAHCTGISTLDNPRGKEVAGCVGSCSGVCRKNYMANP